MAFKELKKHILINGKPEEKHAPWSGKSEHFKNMLKYKRRKKNAKRRFA